MKAYKDVKGKLRLFRPDLNMERLNSSLARLYMPVNVEHSHMSSFTFAVRACLKLSFKHLCVLCSITDLRWGRVH